MTLKGVNLKPNYNIIFLLAKDWQITMDQKTQKESELFPMAKGWACGWLVAEHKDRIIIASHDFINGGEDNDFRMLTAIPKVNIIRRYTIDVSSYMEVKNGKNTIR
jgi:hypothetical protein